MSPVAAAPASPPRAPGQQLSQALQASGLPLILATGDLPWAEPLRRLARQPGLVLARYDALQATAASRSSAAASPLRVLAPLYTEPLYFVVRADAPWTALHQIGRARINVGPAAGARALTVGTAWSALFGRPVPKAQADGAPAATALQRLAARQVDVVALVGELPPGLQRPALAGGLRLLPLDPVHASSRRVLQRFLPVTLAAGTAASGGSAAPVPGLGVMTFLATGADTDDAALLASARALCQALPGLRRDSPSPWRSVRPGAALPAPWPYAPAAAEFRRCDSANASTPQPNPPRS